MSFRSLFAMFSMFVCSAMLFLGLTMSPTLAAPASNPTEGTAQMPESMAAAEDVASKSAPMNLEEIEARNKGGLNEVQGSADADKMYRSDTSKPGPAIARKLEKAIDKVTK
ncbi:hypothetical protein [Alkalinema sp. FACHB-956]|uniref:hypothetical protein n=1 Tax=Alkalinema sp. FACHB-956 TaxID=2692768 RepID=UPI0016831F68|nr:hypothetical protein [Alkalinema sp. FACHB-956]MBD2327993.1 hypothetical protein [Alkalinema sp. FACHB-956]